MKPNPSMVPQGSRIPRAVLGILFLPTLLALGACVVAYRPPIHEAVIVEGGLPPGGVVVDQAPPPALDEVVTVAPAPGLVWIGGYWGWSGGRYMWMGGGWHRPPRVGAAWVGGYWTRRPAGGHVWVRGGWR